MLRWLTGRKADALRPLEHNASGLAMMAAGTLPDGRDAGQWRGFVWVAVPNACAGLVRTGGRVSTFQWFVSEIVRIARDDAPLRRVLGEVIDIVYTARERHPDCTIFVVDTWEKPHDVDPVVHARVLVVRAGGQLEQPGRGPLALPDRRADRAPPALEE